MINSKAKIIITFTIFLTIGCNNKIVEKCNLEIKNNIAFKDGKRFSGDCLIYAQDTILYRTMTYKRGKQKKEIAYYISNGQIEYIGYRKNGQINGDFISYYENGNISIEGQLDEGIYVGEWNYYDDDGSLNKIVIYGKDGQELETKNFK